MRILSLALLLIWAASGLGETEPQDLLVEGYTFVRPTTWKWRAPGDHALSRFIVSGNSEEVADVRFYFFDEDIHERFKVIFQRGSTVEDAYVKIGEVELTYISVTGTAAPRGKEKAKPNYRLVGVALKSREKTNEGKMFLGRLYGPRKEVEAATEDFKKMIEKAVRRAGE